MRTPFPFVKVFENAYGRHCEPYSGQNALDFRILRIQSKSFSEDDTPGPVADPKILKGGGGRQFISSVLIYRKCAQRNICLLHGKKRHFERNMSRGCGRPYRPSLFESASVPDPRKRTRCLDPESHRHQLPLDSPAFPLFLFYEMTTATLPTFQVAEGFALPATSASSSLRFTVPPLAAEHFRLLSPRTACHRMLRRQRLWRPSALDSRRSCLRNHILTFG